MDIHLYLIILGLYLQCGDAGKREAGIQPTMPDIVPYPCPNSKLWKSKIPPRSVHELRPGDIDVVAAIGDSLTAANGAMADNLIEVIFNENRGVSWSIGGEGNWRKYLTVPNMLKVMNPNLRGYSTKDGSVYQKTSQLNLAFNGAMDQDLIYEARRLVARMKSDPKIDINKHWKMVTVMIGTNDICSDQCHRPDEGIQAHKHNLVEVLDYLHAKLPRTLVNLVSMPNIMYYTDLVNPPLPACLTMQLIACSCLFGGIGEELKRQKVAYLTRQFQKVQKLLAESGRYDSREDFTVVYQPTHQDSEFPKLRYPTVSSLQREDDHDYSYVAIDCIHWTQKLHAVAANTYWNNLFELPNNKTTKWIVPAYKYFACPSEERPFIITRQNSKRTYVTKPNKYNLNIFGLPYTNFLF